MSSPFAEAIRALPETDSPEWLRELRHDAFARFEALGLPSTRNEDWHFTSVTPIAERAFNTVVPGPPAAVLSPPDIATLVIGDSSWHRLVFLNGRFEPQWSDMSSLPGSVQVMTLADSFVQTREFVAGHLGKLAAYRQESFTALNTALAHDGVVIHVPSGVVVDAPIHVVHITNDQAAGAAMHPRLLAVIEPMAQVTIVESYSCAGNEAYFTNAVAELEVGDGARLNHYKIQRESHQAFHVGTVQATQGSNSQFHSFSYAAGAALSRTNVYTKLLGEGGETRLNGLYMIDGTQHADHQTFVEHLAPSCASRELYKGILDGTSHGVFNGKVYVDPIAQKTDGKQTNHSLLLSAEARVDTKPQLEIFADDVKCTHGATVGRLDLAALFYMKSRGIGAKQARALLTYAFAAEVLETIELDALREGLEKLAFARFTLGEQR